MDRKVVVPACKAGAGPESVGPTRWGDADRVGSVQPWGPVARNVAAPACKGSAGPEDVGPTELVRLAQVCEVTAGPVAADLARKRDEDVRVRKC